MDYPDLRSITIETIDSFLSIYEKSEKNGGLMCFSVLYDCKKIREATTLSEKKTLFKEFVRFMRNADERGKLSGTIIDLTQKRMGATCAPLDRTSKIGVCPVCGRNGMIHMPYKAFRGCTVHKASPMQMGYSVIESCDW